MDMKGIFFGHRLFVLGQGTDCSFFLHEVLCPPVPLSPKKPCNVPFLIGLGTICWILHLYGHTLFINKVAMEKGTLPKYYMNERSIRETNRTGKQHMMERLGNGNSILVVVTNYVPLTFARCLNDRWHYGRFEPKCFSSPYPYYNSNTIDSFNCIGIDKLEYQMGNRTIHQCFKKDKKEALNDSLSANKAPIPRKNLLFGNNGMVLVIF